MEPEKPQNIEVELPVVGIRKCLTNGREDYNELFERVPIGSTVYMSVNPRGTKFPGSVSVFDKDAHRIGSIGKTERRFIELQIPKGGMLPATVSGHSRHNNCIYVKAINTVGIKEPYIRQSQTEKGEMVFALTSHDEELMRLTALLKTKLLQALDAKSMKAELRILSTAKKYAEICCTSLDGETSFARGEIIQLLKNVRNKYPAKAEKLDKIISDIFEQHKDIGKDDVKTQVYLEQYTRIKDSVSVPLPGKQHSQLEEYRRKLEFLHGRLTDDILQKEINHLSQLLSGELMNTYITAIETPEDFANALYSLNYSMRATYILYTRRILHDYLSNLKAGFSNNLEDNLKRGSGTDNSLSNGLLENREDVDPVVEDLMPIFLNDKQEVVDFLHRIKGVKSTVVTARVNELLKQGKVDKKSCHKLLYTKLHDNGYYKPSLSNWNSQIKHIK